MIKFDSAKSAKNQFWKRSCAVAAVGIAISGAGCSADITRFDQPAFGLTDSSPKSQSSVSSRRTNDVTGYADNTRETGAIAPRQTVRTAALPDISNNAASAESARYIPQTREPEPTYKPQAAPSPNESAGEVEVRRGDTLYGLSRRHGVSINALMRVNGLSSTNLRPGQVLKLPAGASNASAPPRATPRTQRATNNSAPATAPSSWAASYTVERGDSLYKIARRYNISVSDLQSYNAITNPRRVRPGTVLKVPGRDAGRAQPAVARVEPKPRLIEPAATKQTSPSNVGSRPQVAILNAKPAARTSAPRVVQSVAVKPPKLEVPDAASKLRWPVKGKVISHFGRRADGTHNDGINLEVPAGTGVKAADAGVVAYSGSELRGYGKLILVRHENGWVTAYAHNNEVMVKRGDKVARGQVIAKAGKTGQVDRPQVHFELRRDAKPVDPLPYLEQL